jgi:Cys-rich protein (TIGR01571 family)
MRSIICSLAFATSAVGGAGYQLRVSPELLQDRTSPEFAQELAPVSSGSQRELIDAVNEGNGFDVGLVPQQTGRQYYQDSTGQFSAYAYQPSRPEVPSMALAEEGNIGYPSNAEVDRLGQLPTGAFPADSSGDALYAGNGLGVSSEERLAATSPMVEQDVSLRAQAALLDQIFLLQRQVSNVSATLAQVQASQHHRSFEALAFEPLADTALEVASAVQFYSSYAAYDVVSSMSKYVDMLQKSTNESSSSGTNDKSMSMVSYNYIGWASYMVHVLIIAAIYKCCDCKLEPDATIVGDPQIKNKWEFGLFDCCSDPQLALCALCCGPIRWSETLELTNFLSFWVALLAFLLASVPVGYGGPTVVCSMSPLSLLLMLYYRQKIRKLFQIPAYTARTCCQDCLAVALCACCTIIQEAKQLEASHKANHPAVSHLVGQPVAAGRGGGGR